MSAAYTVTIVMIEDDHGHARLIERNLRRAGLSNEVRHLADGASATEYLFGATPPKTPFLVLLDLNLPDVSGVTILERLKADEQLRRAPVIVLTTTDDEREVKRCYELGCNVYITKPVNYETFAQAIQQLGLLLAVIKLPEPE